MPTGPGKYTEACEQARLATKAEGVLLIVFGGSAGDGFECQAPAEIAARLPAILEETARLIRQEFARAQHPERN